MSILDKIISWVMLLFKRIPKELRDKAAKAKQVVDIVRKAVNNPTVQLAVELTNNKVDDKILRCLQQITAWLGASSIEEIPGILRARSEKDRNGTYLKMGSDILSCLDDAQLKENQYDLAMQAVVSNGKLS